MGPRAAPGLQAQAALQEEVQLPVGQLSLRRLRRRAHTAWRSPVLSQLATVATGKWNVEQRRCANLYII